MSEEKKPTPSTNIPLLSFQKSKQKGAAVAEILEVNAIKRKKPSKFFLKCQVSQIQKEHKVTIPIKNINLNENKMSNSNFTGEF